MKHARQAALVTTPSTPRLARWQHPARSLATMAPAHQQSAATRSAFTPATARSTLAAACAAQGVADTDAQLMRFGENAIFRLPQRGVVARIARYPETAGKEVHVAEWLAGHGFPAARLAADLEQLQEFGGTVITWWELIEESAEPPTFVDLAKSLRRLHELPPPQVALPQFEPLALVLIRLDELAGGPIERSELGWLREQYSQLQGAFDELQFQLEPGPIHGDAHIGNLMRGSDGVVRLIDFEVVSHGPREWDVSILGAAWDGFGWMGEDEYRRCVQAYGFDSAAWPGFPTLRAIRELNMATWLAQRMGESDELDREVRQRLADLRDGQAVRRWQPF